MQSDPDRHGEGPEPPAAGSAESIRRQLAASRALCRPGSPMRTVIDAHLVVMDAAADTDTEAPRRPPGQDF